MIEMMIGMALAKDNLRHHPRFPKKLQERVVVEVAEGLTAVPRIILLHVLAILLFNERFILKELPRERNDRHSKDKRVRAWR